MSIAWFEAKNLTSFSVRDAGNEESTVVIATSEGIIRVPTLDVIEFVEHLVNEVEALDVVTVEVPDVAIMKAPVRRPYSPPHSSDNDNSSGL